MPTVRSNDGTYIAYDRYGDGPPVILVGGAFISRRIAKTRQLAELLAGSFAVFNYDRRGRGESGDTHPYSVEREIEDLAALVEVAGAPVALIGWSSGAVLALRAAARGVAVDKLALHEPPLLVDDGRAVPRADFRDRLRALVASDRRGAAAALYLTEAVGAPAPAVAVMRLLPTWSKLKSVANTLPYDWAIVEELLQGHPPRRQDWAAVTVPTLVMSGDKSPAQLRNAARALATALPDGHHRELRGQNHNPSMKVQAAVVGEFLAPGITPVMARAGA